MTKRIFFDTETDNKNPYKANLLELGWIQTNGREEIDRCSELIKPQGRFDEIPQGATDVHGITYEDVKKKGKPLKLQLDRLTNKMKESDYLIAHNVKYDTTVLQTSLMNCYQIPKMPKITTICTMIRTAEWCAIKNQLGDYKWPKLEELYQVVFDEKPNQTHRAIDDAKLVKELYFELLDMNIIIEG